MLIGTIIGNVWATRKHDGLGGSKLMVVQPYRREGGSGRDPVVAVDLIGAGVGETVLVVSGSAARLSLANANTPVDSVIVGIVDTLDIPG